MLPTSSKASCACAPTASVLFRSLTTALHAQKNPYGSASVTPLSCSSLCRVPASFEGSVLFRRLTSSPNSVSCLLSYRSRLFWPPYATGIMFSSISSDRLFNMSCAGHTHSELASLLRHPLSSSTLCKQSRCVPMNSPIQHNYPYSLHHMASCHACMHQSAWDDSTSSSHKHTPECLLSVCLSKTWTDSIHAVFVRSRYWLSSASRTTRHGITPRPCHAGS